MCASRKTQFLILAVTGSVLATAAGSESLMRVALERDAILTPGQMRATVALSDRAVLAGPYEVRLTAFLAGLTVRRQTAGASRESPAAFAVPFPYVQARSEVRCRIELSLGGEFLEAVEQPVFLWPPAAALDGSHLLRDVWVLDASGELQRALRDLDVNTVDAAFQGVRDFALPSVVFIGEFTETQALQMVLARTVEAVRPPVVVFLRQRQFPEVLEMNVAGAGSAPRSVVADMNVPLLKGLTYLDVSRLVAQAVSIEPKGRGGFARACVAEPVAAGSPRRAYLAELSAAGRRQVFCQLPVLDPCDPRQTTMLHNLIELAAAEAAHRRSPAREKE